MASDWNKNYEQGKQGMGPAMGASYQDVQANAEGQRARWQEQDNQRRDRENQERQQQREGDRRYKERMDQWDHFHGKSNKPTTNPKNIFASAKPVVWFFGLVGAVMGAGYSVSQESAWYIGAFSGFVAGGFLGGLLSLFRIGRIILVLIGVALVGGVAYEMFLRSEKVTEVAPDYSVVNSASLQISSCESAINLAKATGANVDNAVAQCNQKKKSFMSGLNSLPSASQAQFCKEYKNRAGNKTMFVSSACKAKGY